MCRWTGGPPRLSPASLAAGSSTSLLSRRSWAPTELSWSGSSAVGGLSCRGAQLVGEPARWRFLSSAGRGAQQDSGLACVRLRI
jgi:hypothetical protein